MTTIVKVLMDVGEFDRAYRFYKDWCVRCVEFDDLELDSMVDVESGYGSAPVSFKHFLSTELFKTGGRNPIPRNVVSFDKENSIRKTRMTSTYITLIDLYRKARDLKDVIKAKDATSVQDKWLLVNLQSTKEFISHMLNRDIWANEAVSQTVVLVIDPITGQKMRSRCGMAVQPENLLEDLVPFMDCSLRDHLAALSHKCTRGNSSTPQDQNTKDYSSASGVTPKLKQVTQNPTYLPLPGEPKGDRNLLCRVGVRLPDGRRTQRNFLPYDPIHLLWSFCCSQLEGDDTKPFRLAHAFPSKSLDYDSKLTFEESGLSNSIIYVTWE
ncbi:hypothetical protein LWI28_009163 [Acer negundo]|uniref:UBX domain-containing protein n=1 Tax=Acer negundo TaxID=4023 RepID=A0AAD5IJ82_ACENE|nr:hypothetical protein LWI28_009163 [Acer negundo]